METSPEIVAVSSQLAAAIELIMDPLAQQERRSAAYTACEEFKENNSLCAQCGLYLAQRNDLSHLVRHFGLQLMEHSVKYRWNQITQEEKLYIKENAMKLLSGGMGAGIQEHVHIKDALSRVIVEMVKREWPQQWPTLLNELFTACQQGENQTELVCFFFLRLVEDVALLQTLESQQRRKDIYQSLTANMREIFGFFVGLMKEHSQRWSNAVQSGNLNQAGGSIKVIKAVIMMLTGYVEWVNISHIIADDFLLYLCRFLTEEHFQALAVECLIQVVNRKGKTEERLPMLVLFDNQLIPYILIAVQEHSTKPLTEPQYIFLKKLIQVLTGMGSQLCTLWGKDDGPSNSPTNLGLYLEAIVVFSQHPSLTVVHLTNTIWLQLFKHELMPKDPVFVTFIGRWVAATAPRIVKVGYPSNRNGGNPESSAYARLDYDTDDEFAAFFHRCRMDLLETFRQATLVAPLILYAYVEEWLVNRIMKSRMEPETPLLDGHEGSFQSASSSEWEAMSQLLECVLGRILIPQERPPVEAGLRLLEMCLSFTPSNPLILSSLLSCISALFVFLSMATTVNVTADLARVLQKIFSALTYSLPGQTKDNRSRVVKNVRRHAASLMVKIGQKYPLLLLPLFDQIHATIKGLNQEPSELSKMETVTLLEALLLINNHFCDFNRQSKFISEVIGEGAQQWLTLGSAFQGPMEFIAFVGLDRPPVEPSSSDLNGRNRSQIIFCVNLIMGTVKRSAWPEDPDHAQKGNFIIQFTDTGNPVYRNPATHHILPLIPNILLLLRILNALWTPDALALLSEGYRGAHNLLDVERCQLLNIGSPQAACDSSYASGARNQTPLERMQQFLSYVHDACYHILGNAGSSLGRDFYQMDNLISMMNMSVFYNIEKIPDYRLRPMVRVFLKPFVHSCPPAFHDTIVLPVLKHLCPLMFVRLDMKWQYITQMIENGQIVEDNADTQEVLDDMLNRMLTREYIDLLKSALLGGGADLNCNDFAMDDGMEMKAATTSMQAEVMSELGMLMLRDEATCNSVVQCLLRALSWSDTVACLKATSLLSVIVRQLVADSLLNATSANVVMNSVFHGLHQHGQHEHNQGSLLMLGVQVYEMLLPQFAATIHELMLSIPGCTTVELHKLDEKILAAKQKPKLDKGKKDIFKKIITPLMGRGTGQLFRKEVPMTNLPRLIIKKPTKPDAPEIDSESFTSLFSIS